MQKDSNRKMFSNRNLTIIGILITIVIGMPGIVLLLTANTETGDIINSQNNVTKTQSSSGSNNTSVMTEKKVIIGGDNYGTIIFSGEETPEPEQAPESSIKTNEPILDGAIPKSKTDLILDEFSISTGSKFFIPSSAPSNYKATVKNLSKDYAISNVCVELKIRNLELDEYVNFIPQDPQNLPGPGYKPMPIPLEPIICVDFDKNTSSHAIKHLVKLDVPGKYWSYHTIIYYNEFFKKNITIGPFVNELIVK